MWKNIWSNIKAFWYLSLVMFGTAGVMLGMGMGPTVTPRIISLLLIVACSLLGVIAIFLHFGQSYVNKREKEIQILKTALHESQIKVTGLQQGFQETIRSLNNELRILAKKYEDSNLPTPTQDELWRAMQGFETPPQERLSIFGKLKALPHLLKKSS